MLRSIAAIVAAFAVDMVIRTAAGLIFYAGDFSVRTAIFAVLPMLILGALVVVGSGDVGSQVDLPS